MYVTKVSVSLDTFITIFMGNINDINCKVILNYILMSLCIHFSMGNCSTIVFLI